MIKTTVYVTRHGETEWNVEGRLQGHRDSSLTLLGKQQARWLGAKLKDVRFDAIYCSSSKRALDTAYIVRGQRDVPLFPLDAMKEMNFGSWEGHKRADIEKVDPLRDFTFWNKPHMYESVDGGESFAELSDRVFPALTEIIANHQGGTLLIVTHAVTLKLILAHFRGDPLEKLWQPPIIHPTALNKVVLDLNQRQSIIEIMGDTSHYRTVRKAVGAIVLHESKVMLVHKIASSYGKIDGVWDFPKGGVEDEDSNPEQAILRELLEETGSASFKVIRLLPEPLRITFGDEIRAKIGYERQETTMFIVEYDGDGQDWRPMDGEIDDVELVHLAELESRLSHEETREYFVKHVRETVLQLTANQVKRS